MKREREREDLSTNMKTLVDVTSLPALVVKVVEGSESDRGKTHISCYETIPLINQKEEKIYKPISMKTTYKKKRENLCKSKNKVHKIKTFTHRKCFGTHYSIILIYFCFGGEHYYIYIICNYGATTIIFIPFVFMG